MRPRLRVAVRARAAGVLTVLALVLPATACDDDPSGGSAPSGATPGADATSAPAAQAPPVAFRASDVPAGSSGTLVAALDGEVLACRGWGWADRGARVRAGCDTVYDVMSMTKQFTAAAVLRLQMEGRLRVTDPIGRHLDGVPPDKRRVTVHHLLAHTSGLVDSLGDDYDPLTRAGLVAGALASDLRTRPGARYHYSNVGYSLLAAIVEEASGQAYEEYLAGHLFAPAGMTHTGYVLPDWASADVAVEYDAHGRPQGRPFDHPWAADGPWWNLRGNGGMLSTARDMARWHRALGEGRVLDAAATAALFRPRVVEEPGGDSRYAYGWVVVDTPMGPVQWHNGGNGWSYGVVARLPRSDAFVFWVANRSRGRPGGWDLERSRPDLTATVLRRLHDAAGGSRGPGQ